MNQLVNISHFRVELDRMGDQFAAALPAHIPVKRFVRTVMTALQNTPDLAKCERSSIWNSSMRCAQDGLLPDGREAAIVPYKNKAGHLVAQYMPMIAGLRKKARNSGEIVSWDCHAVYEQDEFDYQLGDQPFIYHKPTLAAERGPMIAVYSIAVLKSGDKSRDVMSAAEVDRIRNMARAKGGPAWTDHYAEMAKKTVARRHSKTLPMSSDLDDLLRRDDQLYEGGDVPPRPRLADYPDDDVKRVDVADAYEQGIEARDAGKVVDPPSSLPDEFHEPYRAGWKSRDDELKVEGDEHSVK